MPAIDYQISQAAVEAARKLVETGDSAASRLKELANKGEVALEAPGVRVFVNPTEPNTRYLVHAGPVRKFQDPNSPTGFREWGRDGDIWANFAGGICATDDPLVVEWLIAHSGSADAHVEYHQVKKEDPRRCGVPYGLCRDAAMKGVSQWASIKYAQQNTARTRDVLSPSIDVDAFLEAGLKVIADPSDATTPGARFAATAAANAAAMTERAAGKP